MKGDFTRQTFRSQHHYRGVLQQQGRVQLDADWNEQVLIQAHMDRLSGRDTVGAHGAPQDAAGMGIVGTDGQPPAGPVPSAELRISPGRYYVSGILCENEDLLPLDAQPDLPSVPLPTDNGSYTAFLDVWHEHLTALERPELREVALGGPDTTTRSRTIWQVRLRTADEKPPPVIGAGQLRARAESSGDITDACDVPTGTGYRRLENQLYRVEIRDPGDPGRATFLWSRENGSVTARLVTLDGNTLTLDSTGRDDRLSFDKGWVQVTDSARARRGEPGFLGSIGHVYDNTITVAEWSGGAPAPGDLGTDPIVRRWESGPLTVTLPATPDEWTALESGVEIQFRDGGFRTGDYWLITARTANLEGRPAVQGLAGNVDWPQDNGDPAYQPPDGIRHAYADIADMTLAGGYWTVTDRRPVFPPLTDIAADIAADIAVGYAGGDGQQVPSGSALPQPLEVSVTRRGTAVPGATVRFEAADTGGLLAAKASDLAGSASHLLNLPTGPDGVARCWWRPANDPARPSQRVTARRIGPDGQPALPLVDFTAAFADASSVSFDPAGCTRLVGATTVQAAIGALAATPVLVPIAGDGQDGQAGSPLPRPVTVRVITGCGDPVGGVTVQFSVADGAVASTAGALAGAGAGTSVNLSTATDGSADCWWRLGKQTPVQTLTAALFHAGAPAPAIEPFMFVAGAVSRGGLQVTGVLLAGDVPLPNDGEVAAGDLATGLTVLLDRDPPDPAAVSGKPVLTVTLDLPYPLSEADRAVWGDAVTGAVPLTLAGEVGTGQRGGRSAVTWTAGPPGRALLGTLFGVLTRLQAVDRVLGHLALDSRVTGDAGWTQWFWLVGSIVNLVLVPNRQGKLNLASGRELVTRAVSRDALRAGLRAGAHVADGPDQDLDVARRAAGNAFRNGSPRTLVLLTTQQHAAAAGVIRDALAAFRLTVDVVLTADLLAEASTRLAASQQIDGILTDDADLAAITTALPDFPEGFPL